MEIIRIIYCNTSINKQRGMTLIELIIVIAIIGILTAITYPNYSEHIRKSHRKQAMVDMVKIQLHMEQKYNEGYTTNGFLTNGKCNEFCDVDKERYEISATITGKGYLISATPKIESGQHKDKCMGSGYERLTLSNTGEAQPNACWM